MQKCSLFLILVVALNIVFPSVSGTLNVDEGQLHFANPFLYFAKACQSSLGLFIPFHLQVSNVWWLSFNTLWWNLSQGYDKNFFPNENVNRSCYRIFEPSNSFRNSLLKPSEHEQLAILTFFYQESYTICGIFNR